MDVHQETIVVCVLTTDSLGEVQSEVRTFGTLTKHLFELLKSEIPGIAGGYSHYNGKYRDLLEAGIRYTTS